MRRVVSALCAAAVGSFAGCAAIPPVENPVVVRPAADVENPILVAPGVPTPAGYTEVVERTLDVLDDYFEIKPGSRLSGVIETKPQTAAGFEQPWRPGTPDQYERLLATFQSIRHYAIVRIEAGERGGFRVYVEVYKELEDIPRPAQALTGAALFREEPTVDRRIETVAPIARSDRAWIPKGRDPAFEQVILRKIQKAMYR